MGKVNNNTESVAFFNYGFAEFRKPSELGRVGVNIAQRHRKLIVVQQP